MRCRDGGAWRSRTRDAAGAGAARAEGRSPAGRAAARHSRDRRHAGARVDDDRAAADARRGQRRGQRGRRGRRRDHAGRRDGGRRGSRCAPCSALDAIVREAEATSRPSRPPPVDLGEGHAARSARRRSRWPASGDADAIVAVTRGGATARLLSSLRPPATIIAATERHEMARRLMLCWGVVPAGWKSATTSTRPGSARSSSSAASCRPGATIVFVSVNATSRAPTRTT